MNNLVALIILFFIVHIVSHFITIKFCNKKLHKKKMLLLFMTVAFFLSYFTLIFFVKFYDVYLNFKLNLYDLNKDGVFSINEQTSEQIIAMNSVVNDTGRNLISLTAIPISIIISLLSSILFWLKKPKARIIGTEHE